MCSGVMHWNEAEHQALQPGGRTCTGSAASFRPTPPPPWTSASTACTAHTCITAAGAHHMLARRHCPSHVQHKCRKAEHETASRAR